jgi:hypothetical protein
VTFLLAAALLVGSGLALLALLRLRTGAAAADAALAWFVGSGVYAGAASLARFLLHLPIGRAAALALVLAPPAIWAALAVRRRRAGPPALAGGAAPAPRPASRWLPRPLWIFAPLALYVAVVLVATVLHGVNTPTLTDDGVRVRAFAPILAFQDAWSTEARAIFVMAGPVTTFVPALGWTLSGTVVHFHVNDAVLADLVAFLVLLVGLGSARGSPERGWAGAFALLSIPLLVYHCTQTYADAVLAIRLAAALLLGVEFARTGDRGDARRSLLLVGLVALVKREGEFVAVAAAVPVVGQLLWERLRGGKPFPWGAVALAVVPALASPVSKLAAAGAEGFPLVAFILQQVGLARTPPADVGVYSRAEAARIFFSSVLFRSGNSGMIYWVLPAAIAVRARTAVRDGLAWPLLGLAALLGEVAITSIVLLPRFTVDHSAVHRALLVVTVPAAVWLAAALSPAPQAGLAGQTRPGDEPAGRRGAEDGDEASGGAQPGPAPARKARAEPARPRRRKR